MKTAQAISRTSFFIPSFDKTPLAATKFIPSNPKAVLIWVHGMQDHQGTHFPHALRMAKEQFAVYCYDHRGEGATAGAPEACGFIAEQDGWEILTRDMAEVINFITRENPNHPIFLLAHSMASFIAQSCISAYPLPINGVILCGCTYLPSIGPKLLVSLLEHYIKKTGPRYPIPKIEKLVCRYFSRRFKETDSVYAWICSNPDRIKQFLLDPYCGWEGSISFYRDLVSSFPRNNSRSNRSKIPKELPIFLVAGKDDALCNFGKSVVKLYKQYKKLEIKNLKVALYPGARHEPMNEKDNQLFFEDLFLWLDSQLTTSTNS